VPLFINKIYNSIENKFVKLGRIFLKRKKNKKSRDYKNVTLQEHIAFMF